MYLAGNRGVSCTGRWGDGGNRERPSKSVASQEVLRAR